jgi:hypothetical protein
VPYAFEVRRDYMILTGAWHIIPILFISVSKSRLRPGSNARLMPVLLVQKPLEASGEARRYHVACNRLQILHAEATVTPAIITVVS